MAHETRLPHSLRITIFFLRITLGLNFFYLGWTVLFNHSLEATLHAQTLSNLYSWLARATPVASIPSSAFAWIFMILGTCIVIGLFTRLSSILAIIIILASWLPAISFSNFAPAQLLNGEVIALIAFFILVFARAGHYFGLDNILHISMRKKKE